MSRPKNTIIITGIKMELIVIQVIAVGSLILAYMVQELF
jgi:hypothetical protein